MGLDSGNRRERYFATHLCDLAAELAEQLDQGDKA